jgi:hypothetical protein
MIEIKNRYTNTDILTPSSAELNPAHPGAQRAWILAGNATFTLVSNRTGARYTYKVKRDKLTTDLNGRYHVLLLVGPDNESSFAYLGSLRGRLRQVETGGVFDIEELVWEFHRGQRSPYADDSPPIKVFRWMWWRLSNGIDLASAGTSGGAGAHLLHAGRCGRCGRTLTVPESIESGYGPECAGLAAPGGVK